MTSSSSASSVGKTEQLIVFVSSSISSLSRYGSHDVLKRRQDSRQGGKIAPSGRATGYASAQRKVCAAFMHSSFAVLFSKCVKNVPRRFSESQKNPCKQIG